MTQNYKWYRLLSREEFNYISWGDVFKNHGYVPGKDNYTIFAPDLMGDVDMENRPVGTLYGFYVEWWTEHFGTKLHRHLYGVDDVL
jgi:hypothetical protein